MEQITEKLKKRIEDVSEVLSKILVLSYLPNSRINREEVFRYLKLIGDALIVLSLEEVTKTLNLPQKDRKDVRLTLEYAIKRLDEAYEYLKFTEEQIILHTYRDSKGGERK